MKQPQRFTKKRKKRKEKETYCPVNSIKCKIIVSDARKTEKGIDRTQLNNGSSYPLLDQCTTEILAILHDNLHVILMKD